jgi:hypothetical protein
MDTSHCAQCGGPPRHTTTACAHVAAETNGVLLEKINHYQMVVALYMGEEGVGDGVERDTRDGDMGCPHAATFVASSLHCFVLLPLCLVLSC